jgi:hypothetical protein
MAFAEQFVAQAANPVDMIEQIASSHDWATERTTSDELTLVVAGSWTDYHVSLNWRNDLETLHLACAFDFKIPENRLTECYKLVAQINEQLWIGHFDIWANEGLIMYRHGLMLSGSSASESQCEAMLKAALEAVERYYQTFQFVVWAGKDAKTAMTASMFHTAGEA